MASGPCHDDAILDLVGVLDEPEAERVRSAIKEIRARADEELRRRTP